MLLGDSKPMLEHELCVYVFLISISMEEGFFSSFLSMLRDKYTKPKHNSVFFYISLENWDVMWLSWLQTKADLC